MLRWTFYILGALFLFYSLTGAAIFFAFGADYFCQDACFISTNLFMKHDWYWFISAAVLAIIAYAICRAELATQIHNAAQRSTSNWPAWVGIAVLTTVLIAAASGPVYRHLPLWMDEIMAEFYVTIVAEGAGIAKVSDNWKHYLGSLQPIFMHVNTEHGYLMPMYLPLAAAIRAAFMYFGASFWTGAVVSGLALCFLWSCLRRIFPEHKTGALFIMALMATSQGSLPWACIKFMSTRFTPSYFALICSSKNAGRSAPTTC